MNECNIVEYSVLMSVYYKDNPEWLKKAIDSMLNQTKTTNDFVIIKDGELTEELNNTIVNYQKEYPHIFHVIELKKNMGLGEALRIGVENCKNEFIARIDADDYSVQNRCEKQLKRISENLKIDMIGSNHIEFVDCIENKKSYLYKVLPSSYEEIKKYAKRRNPFSHSAMMLRKSKIIEAGNYRNYYLVEDYDLWVRMIEKNAYCENINEFLSYVRVGKDLYKRRGGLKYLKSMLKFKRELYNRKFYSFKDYIISSGAHIVMCIIPYNLRNVLYKKLLRR